jgi:CubicO group peptidase (beta-lactamase class C family)
LFSTGPVFFQDMAMLRKLVPLLAASLVLSGCVMAARHTAQRARAAVDPPAIKVSGGPAPQKLIDEVTALADRGIPVTAVVMKNGKLLYRVDAGAITPETRYPVASASKWLTAALVMTVVDEGKLKLDAPVSDVLPEFKGESGAITLRMLLAQTAGLGNLRSRVDVRQDPRMTLAQSAAEVAARPLAHPPGTVFEYGGPQFQVAGAMVEKVTGTRWSELFDERIARPLGMTHTTWEHLPARGVSAAQTLNPLLQGGAVTTADDYMRFLTMLAAGGRIDGHQILSAQAVQEMEVVQTLGLAKGYLPPGAGSKGEYALGNWCEQHDADRNCTLVSSPGAFGTLPWIDRSTGTYGIFFLKDLLVRTGRHLRAARAAAMSP